MSNRKQLSRNFLNAITAFALCGMSLAHAQSAAQEGLRVQALFAEPGKPSVYEIAFTTKEALPPNAEFSFEFPVEFDLAQVQIAGSPDINGGFAVKRDKQKVLVQRSGLGQSVASGTLVRLRLGAIINPKNLENGNMVAMQVRAATQSAWTMPAKASVIFTAAEKSE